MVDPINKTSNFQGSNIPGGSSSGYQVPSTSASSNANRGKKKNDHCWKFNKGPGHCNEGKNCKWPHKCKYCDSTAHGFANCPKRSHGSTVTTNK